MRRLSLLTVLPLVCCAGATTNLSGEVTYAKDAKGNYQLGERALEDHDWLAASQYFTFTKSKFPYSQYAPLSELRLADSLFAQDKYLEAIDAYKNFLKDHPTHPKVDFAAFQIAKCHYKDLPGDFFLFPPVYEKDQQELVDAQAAVRDYLGSFPESQFHPDAQKMMDEIRRRLAEHEWYVAGFYEGRGFKKAAAWRYEGIVKNFADTRFAAPAAQKVQALYAKLPPNTRRASQPAAGSDGAPPPPAPGPALGPTLSN